MTSPLKRIRRQRKLTLQEVANATGTDTGNLSRIERGKQVASKDMAEKLSKFFGGAVTETEIIYPERFMEPPDCKTVAYAGPERRKGIDAQQSVSDRRGGAA